MINHMKTCQQCGYHFSAAAKKFYCCNTNSPVCILCMSKKCKVCGKQRFRELSEIKCNRCLKSCSFTDMFHQASCDKSYCSKCLCNLYYQQFLKSMEGKDQGTIKLYCGHLVPSLDLREFMYKYCIGCGTAYNKLSDFTVNGHLKLCDYCFKYENKKYQKLLHKCVSCEGVIRNYDQKSYIEGMIICDVCKRQQSLMENQYSNISKEKQLQQKKDQIKKEHEKKEHEKKIVEKEKQEIKSIQKIKKQQQIIHPKSPEKEILLKNAEKNVHILKSGAKKSQQIKDNKQASKAIKKQEHLFQNKLKQKEFANLGLLHKNSVETILQNERLNIKRNINKKFRCIDCSALIDEDETLGKEINARINNLIDSRDLKVPPAKENDLKNRVCRLCYSQSLNNVYLGFNRDITNLKLNQERLKHVSLPKNNSPSSKSSYNIPSSKPTVQQFPITNQLPLTQPLSKTYAPPYKYENQGKKITFDNKVSKKLSNQFVDNFFPKKNLTDLCEICKDRQSKITTINQNKYCLPCYEKRK